MANIASDELYQPLSSRDTEIRLLSFSTGHGTELLSCTLHHALLTPDLHYEALSYTWGDETATMEIIVNGKKTRIRRNLYKALLQFREKHTEHDRLWVDALCIDQDNISERNEQVKRMRQIYRYAHQIIVWLGVEKEDSDLAMELAIDFESNAESVAWVSQSLAQPGSYMHWKALGRLLDSFNRPYWRRLWVVQEIISARKCEVYCGYHATTLQALDKIGDAFDEAMRLWPTEKILPDHQKLTDLTPLGASGPWLMSNAVKRDETCPFYDLQWYFLWNRCQDPRDKVYALASLSEIAPSNERTLHIDYSQSVNQVFGDAARAVIKSKDRLDVLCLCGSQADPPQNRPHQEEAALPSWVPDLRIGALQTSWNWTGPGNATGNHDADAKISADGCVINVGGLGLCTIEKISHPLPFESLDGGSRHHEIQRGLWHWRSVLLNYIDNGGRKMGSTTQSAYRGAILEQFYAAITLNQRHIRPLGPVIARVRDCWSKWDTRGPPSSGTELDPEEIACLEVCTSPSSRSFFIGLSCTAPGLRHVMMGLCSSGARAGDMAWLILGCKWPIILRKQGNQYQKVGPSEIANYIDDDNEQIRNLEGGRLSITRLDIV